jgi:hypothetical protein
MRLLTLAGEPPFANARVVNVRLIREFQLQDTRIVGVFDEKTSVTLLQNSDAAAVKRSFDLLMSWLANGEAEGASTYTL